MVFVEQPQLHWVNEQAKVVQVMQPQYDHGHMITHTKGKPHEEP